MISKKITAILLTLILLPGFLSAKPVVFDFTQKTKKNAIIRSVLLPGWGQFFEGKTAKGYIVSIGSLISASFAYYYFSESNKSYDIYKNIGLIEDSSYTDYQDKANKAYVASIALALLWLYGIADVYFSSKSPDEYSDSHKSKNYCKKDGLKFALVKDDLKLVFSKTF